MRKNTPFFTRLPRIGLPAISSTRTAFATALFGLRCARAAAPRQPLARAGQPGQCTNIALARHAPCHREQPRLNAARMDTKATTYTGPGKLSGWGYPSQLPCAVCGQHTPNNQAEPRFYYTVCPAHQHVPPVEIGDPK